MPTTSNFGLHYPAATDAPDGAGAIFQLAIDVESALGVWTAYNPAFSNTAALSATGEYVRSGRTVHFKGQATFQAGGTVGGQIRMSLPIGMRANSTPTGVVYGTDTGVGYYDLFPINVDGGTIAFMFRPASQTMLQSTSSSAPFVWGPGDMIQWDLWYGID